MRLPGISAIIIIIIIKHTLKVLSQRNCDLSSSVSQNFLMISCEAYSLSHSSLQSDKNINEEINFICSVYAKIRIHIRQRFGFYPSCPCPVLIRLFVSRFARKQIYTLNLGHNEYILAMAATFNLDHPSERFAQTARHL